MNAETHARATLDDLASRRRIVTDAIRTLAAFYGLPAAEWLTDTAPAAAAAPEPSAAPAAATSRTRKPKGAKREPRPTEAPPETATQLLAALKNNARTPAAMSKATGLPLWTVKNQLRAMLKRGLVKRTGRARGSKYHAA